jgi:hypothetical protein
VSALAQDAGQGGLAHLDRLPPKVRAVQLKQVESVGNSKSVMAITVSAGLFA